MAELKTYVQKVASLLKESERARNCDKYLQALFISKFHSGLLHETNGRKAIYLANYLKLPSMENVRRARAIIQNDKNLYLPSDPKVRKQRRIKEENWTNCEIREAKQETLL